MTQILNSDKYWVRKSHVSVIEILNLIFVWNLELEIWCFFITYPNISYKFHQLRKWSLLSASILRTRPAFQVEEKFQTLLDFFREDFR